MTVIWTSHSPLSSTKSRTAGKQSTVSPSIPNTKQPLTAMPWDWMRRMASRYPSRRFRFQLLFSSTPSRLPAVGTLQADQNFGATRFSHQVKDFGVVGHGNVGLGEPLDAFVGQGPQQLFGMGTVDERVVVGKFDEGARPDLFDCPYLADHVFHGLQLVALGHHDGAGAEVAPPRAAALGLHRDPVVFVGVQQVEPGQRRVGKIELLPPGTW